MMINKTKYIVLLSLLLLLMSLNNKVMAQKANDTIYVSGYITDAATHQPIVGARIQAGNFSTILTGERGNYKLRIPSDNVLLVVSYSGYLTRVVATQGKKQLDVNIFAETFVAPNKNVNAYHNSSAITLEDELQTRFGADLRAVRRSGLLGMGSNLFIRGYNSLNANATPLIVVDGVIWDDMTNQSSINNGYFINPLTDIDVTDIESIDVLKNASSLYGSKGGNGVILIKTNRGHSEATRITFDATTGVVQKPTLPPVLNASQYRMYATDVLKQAGYSQASLNKLQYLQDDPTSQTYMKYHNDVNWGDQVYQNGLSNHYALSVQGGDDIAKYGFSLAYTGVKGVLKETSMDRLNTRFNSDIHLGKKVNIATNISFTQVDRDLRDDGINNISAPGYISQIKSPLFNPYKYTTAGVLTSKLEGVDAVGVSNPLSILTNGIGNHKQYRFLMSAEPQWDINKSLTLSSNFSYSINKVNEHYFTPINGVSPDTLIKSVGSFNAVIYGVSQNVVKDQSMQQLAFFNDTKLKYDKLLDNIHHVNGLVGLRYNTNRFENDYGEGHNTGGDYVTNLLASLDYRQIGGANESWSSTSMYAQAGYEYARKYSVWAVASLDNSSRFGSATKDGFNINGNTWVAFPSAGASWLVSSESFMKHLTFVDKLNLRASYGISGNDNIGNYQHSAYLTSVNYIDKAVGLQISNLRNEGLQWETTTKADAGIDLSLLNDRINISADIYKNRTDNLLTLKQLSDVTGLGSYWTNEGSLQNTGYEVTLGLKLVNLKSFKWNMNVSASHYVNKVLSLPDGDYSTTIYNAEVRTSVGNPLGMFYGYKTLGVFSSADEASKINNGKGLKILNINGTPSYFGAGDVHFDDVDGNGIINEKDKQPIGNPNPDLTGAIVNNFSLGNFTLDVVFTYSYGNDIYNYMRYNLENMSSMDNQSLATLNRWKADGQVTNMPKAVYGDPLGNSRFSDRWIEDGSYLKLQNVRLSYQLPLKSNVIEGLTFWTSVSNVVTFTKYLGSDPENSMSQSVLYQGIDAGLLPASRIYNVGVKINL